MSLNTTLDITKVITTTLQSIDPSPTLATTFGVVSTQLGSATTSTVATTIGTGLIGNTGATGAEGDSAYTVWIKQGHVGTEQDFLDSLVSTVPGPAGTTDYLDLINKPFIPSNLSDLLPDSTHRVVTDAQIIAWDSIPTATNLSSTSDAVSVTVLSSTGTDTTIPAASSSLAGVATATQITKLNGIADGATANSSDATLLSRANHTGTQAQNTVEGLVDSLASKQPLSSVLTNTSASFTTVLETKLNGVATGAEVNTASNIGASGIGIYRQKIGVDLQFKNIYATGALDIGENLSNNVITIQHTDTTSIRHVTDAEKALWNSKQAALGFTPVPDTRTISGKPLNGDITLLKGDVGLGNVDNTADASKPISTATQAALNGKEPSFTKNTAFNKNFGSSAGTVCEGNDSRLSDQRSPTTHSASHSSGGSDALSHNNLANLNVGEYKHLTAAEYSSNVYEAPVDNKQYARKNSAWVEVSTTAGSEQNMFIQNSPPVVTEGLHYLWVQTGIGGGSMTFWVEDGL